MLKFFIGLLLLTLVVVLVTGAVFYFKYIKPAMDTPDYSGNQSNKLHQLAKRGDSQLLATYLNDEPSIGQQINQHDSDGITPLAYAIEHADGTLDLIRLLVNEGADINLETHASYERGLTHYTNTPLQLAINNLDLAVIKYLVAQGADLHYEDKNGYAYFLRLAYASYQGETKKVLPLVKYFLEQKVDIHRKPKKYNESAINRFYLFHRYEILAYLLAQGVDLSELNLSELMHTILFKDIRVLEEQLKKHQVNGTLKEQLAHNSSYERNPLMLTVLQGSTEKIKLMMDYSDDTYMQDRVRQSLPFYAVESNNPDMLKWLLDQYDFDLTAEDEYKTSLLEHAVENNQISALKTLLNKGIDLHVEDEYGFTVLHDVDSVPMAELLLEAGIKSTDLPREIKRSMLGMSPDFSDEYKQVSLDEYKAGRYYVFGRDNPSLIEDKFKAAMVRAGVSSYRASNFFDPNRDAFSSKPIWNVDRYGQSFTRLPDGRIIEIGGEHEDSYDPDFQIYNDVIVHDGKGGIEIYGYPKTIFPPTDFHSATIVGDKIYIIGSLGYYDAREAGVTPVYILDTNDYHIEKMVTSGENPGWIYKHHAEFINNDKIKISQGEIYKDAENYNDKNQQIYYLDLSNNTWSKAED